MAPITRGLAALERALALIEQTPVEQGGTHAVARARGEIELEGVSLRYAQADSSEAAPPFALQDVSLHVRAGETVALVGPSGAGKTSLVNLLPRFLDPTAGEIRLDGVPLRQWELGALRRQFAFVSQDVVLFNDTVAANVALGAPLDAARLRAALEGAYLMGFVQGLPQGVDTPVGHNGSQLSGGQRQRLAIARALYKDAPLLILDEATEGLAPVIRAEIWATLAALKARGQAILVIDKNLSALTKLADEELGLIRIELDVSCHNTHAIRLYERHGFVKEGVMKQETYVRGQYRDSFAMGRVRRA
jgi:subfamily B ATP-binding cassette protein MsbA